MAVKCAEAGCKSTAEVRWKCDTDNKVRCDAHFHVGKDGAAVLSKKSTGYCCKMWTPPVK